MEDVLLLVIGWALGFLSSITTLLLQHRFEMRKLRETWAREDALREDDRAREAQQRKRAEARENWRQYQPFLRLGGPAALVILIIALGMYAMRVPTLRRTSGAW